MTILIMILKEININKTISQEPLTLRSMQLYVLKHLLFKFYFKLTFTKQFKEETDDDLSICLDECRPSITWIFLNPL